jgi:C4-dicarboxylate transporter, DctM subunit
MDPTWVALCTVVVLLVFLASGLWVALALMATGFAAMALFTAAPVGPVMATSIWGATNSWALAAIPLFIWMGEILSRSRVSEHLFNGLAPLLRRVPGGLIHINVLGCGLFAAVSGSSVATAATLGRITVPALLSRGYPERLTLGSLAGSGTLGFLIPPSIILIVYGVAVDESVVRLFLAGIIPGLVLMVLFSGYVVVWSVVNRERMPPPDPAQSLGTRVRGMAKLLPILALIIGILGSIELGIASPTDAAAVGVVLALILSWRSRTLDWPSFAGGLTGAIRTSCMIAFILIGASFLTVAMGFTGVPGSLAASIGAMNLSAEALIVALTVLFVILGCFLDGISMVVLTTAVILPVIETAGIDRIWFGIYLAVVVEMSQITPPIGFNLFAIQGMTGRNVLVLARAALPFFCMLLLLTVLLVLFPGLATWLPNHLATP